MLQNGFAIWAEDAMVQVEIKEDPHFIFLNFEIHYGVNSKVIQKVIDKLPKAYRDRVIHLYSIWLSQQHHKGIIND